MNLRRALSAALLLATLWLVPGCSDGPGYSGVTVTGTVTIDGSAVPKGYITFSPADAGQGPVTGAAITGGAYRCENVPLGKHTVTFTAQAAEMETIVDQVTGGTHQVPKNILPANYLSGVDATVEAGGGNIDFALAGDGG